MRAALDEALSGGPSSALRLEILLARHGGLPSPRPNLKLAAAFGEEAAFRGPAAIPLVLRMATFQAGDDDPREFLPVAAAFAIVALLRQLDKEPRELDGALLAVASHEVTSVRLGAAAALCALGARDAAALLARAEGWLETEDREARFAALGTSLDAITDPHVLSAIREPQGLLDFLDRAIDTIVSAPRAAERSPARRRALVALSHALVPVLATVRAAHPWLVVHCETATHEELREAIDRALGRLHDGKVGKQDLEVLHDALRSSKKPPRDPSRIKHGTRGRGRKGRRT